MVMQTNGWYHVGALLTVSIWGTTFVSTRVLLDAGLPPADIFCIRFGLAYLGLLPLVNKRLWANTWRDEGCMLLLGLMGGSSYFFLENTALQLTQASHVALTVSTAPVFIGVISALRGQERLSRSLIFGSLLALAGVALVAFSGIRKAEVNLWGDVLALCAALGWAFYQLLVKKMSLRYSTGFITRKVFGYGVLTMCLYYLFFPVSTTWSMLKDFQVWSNLLFLGVIASMSCYLLWNTVVRKLGPLLTSNYIYLVPLVALLTSVWVLKEPVTLQSVAGAVAIMGGVYWVERGH